MVRGRANPGDIDRLLLNTATQDSNRVRVGFGQVSGAGCKSQALHLVRAFRIVIALTRAEPRKATKPRQRVGPSVTA